jgi:hypothetical protein
MKRPGLDCLLGLTAVLLCVAAGKEPVFLISFHEEGQSIDGPKKVKPLSVNGETHYFRLSPLFTQNNIQSYWPFQSQDGQSWGAVFWLDNTGQHVLERVGVANRGQFVAAAVNRVPLDLLYVDGQAKDHRIVIWKGLSPEIFKAIDATKKIRRLSNPAPAAVAAAGQIGRAAAAPVGTNPVAGAPLPDGAVVSDLDPASLDAATADTALNPTKEKKSGWNPLKWFKKEPNPSKPSPAPPIPPAPVVQPDAAAERPAVVPLTELPE